MHKNKCACCSYDSVVSTVCDCDDAFWRFYIEDLRNAEKARFVQSNQEWEARNARERALLSSQGVCNAS